MRYYHLLIFLLLFGTFTAIGQITTHSFMKFTTCPTDVSQVHLCKGWDQPTSGTSDYFNACAAGTAAGVPDNFLGSQDAPEKAYAGLFTWMEFEEYREYIGTKITPLVVGKTYTMTLSVSLADRCQFASDGLGALFTTSPVSITGFTKAIRATPQVDYSDHGIITDTQNWTILSKTFVADSAYTYLTVGSFKPDVKVSKTLVPSAGPFRSAYYYILQIGDPDSTIPPPIDTTQPPDPPANYAFPSAFSPGNDGLNDKFRIIGDPANAYKDYVLSIYDRWGQLVFYSEYPEFGWDGNLKGIPQPIGAYVYLCRFTLRGKHKMLKGDVTLIR